MKQENVQYFTEEEEQFTNLLIDLGTKKNIAKVLVFLMGTPQATSRAIDRGTDLRQADVSLAMKYLTEQGWIKCQESRSGEQGRPTKIYELAKPVHEIMNSIEKGKRKEMDNQLALLGKLRDYLP